MQACKQLNTETSIVRSESFSDGFEWGAGSVGVGIAFSGAILVDVFAEVLHNRLVLHPWLIIAQDYERNFIIFP